MAPRGRKPKPTAHKRRDGSRQPIRPDEPEVPPGEPRCPAVLDGEARAEWERIVPELLDAGVLTQIDRAALTGYCSAWGWR